MPSIHRNKSRSWSVCWREPGGKQHKRTFPTAEQAEAFTLTLPRALEGCTLESYARRWLALAPVERSTKSTYGQAFAHILPALGSLRLGELSRGAIKAFLSEKAAAGMATSSVFRVYGTLRTVLFAAVEDGLLPTNPAARLGRSLRLRRNTAPRALTRAQRDALLLAAEGHWLRPLLFVLSRTGLRIGEALALRVGDVAASTLRVERALCPVTGTLKTTKTGEARAVDLSPAAVTVLRPLVEGRADDDALFPTASRSTVAHAFRRLLAKAQLPAGYCTHSLRHTYATLMLEAGAPLEYVSRQLGHSTLALTADTYARGRRGPSRAHLLD